MTFRISCNGNHETEYLIPEGGTYYNITAAVDDDSNRRNWNVCPSHLYAFLESWQTTVGQYKRVEIIRTEASVSFPIHALTFDNRCEIHYTVSQDDCVSCRRRHLQPGMTLQCVLSAGHSTVHDYDYGLTGTR